MFKSRNIYLAIKLQVPVQNCISAQKYVPGRPRVEANNFPDLFCGKSGCILLKSYFLAQSVEIKSCKLELLEVLVVERWLQQALAQALHLFPLPFPISKHSESERKRRGVPSASERSPTPRSKDFKIHLIQVCITVWLEKQKNCHARGTTSRKVEELCNCERHTGSCKEERLYLY